MGWVARTRGLQNGIDESRRRAEIIKRVEEAIEVGGRKMSCDIGLGREDVAKVAL